MHDIVDKVILSAIAIGVTLSFFSVVDEQIVGCSNDSPLLSTYCIFSINTWNVNADGHSALELLHPETLFVLDTLKIAPLIHLCVSFIGWILYVLNLKLSAAFTIALAHINGWIVLAAVSIHQKDFNVIASTLSSVDHSVLPFDHWSIGVMASVAASSLQFLTVVAILVKTYLDRE